MIKTVVQALPFKPSQLPGLEEATLCDYYQSRYGALVRDFVAEARPEQQLRLLGQIHLAECFLQSLGGEGGSGGPGVGPCDPLKSSLCQTFGSYGQWQQDFSEKTAAAVTANAAQPCWVVCGWSAIDERVRNLIIAGNAQLPAGFVPLVCVDSLLFKFVDQQQSASTIVKALLANIHWQRAANRLELLSKLSAIPANGSKRDSKLPIISVNTLQHWLNSEKELLILDICLPEDRPKRYDKIPSAILLNPSDVLEGLQGLNEAAANRTIVAYCMYGFQVSQDAVKTLCSQGVDARLLSGGIACWRASGARTVEFK